MSVHNKKKKKRSVIQCFKKQARSHNHGKGNHLAEEKYNYYIRIFEQLRQIENEDKDILIKNFFRELLREENVKGLIVHQLVSRILDDALPLASVDSIIAIINIFNKDLRLFIVDQYASHVLQTLLIASFKQIQVNQEELDKTAEIVSEEQHEILRSFIIKTSKFIYNNLSEFVCHVYASHVIRTVLELCSGVEVSKKIKGGSKVVDHSIKCDTRNAISNPEELLVILRDISVRLTQLPDFPGTIQTNNASAILQTCLSVLNVLQETTLSSKIVNHILFHGFDCLISENEECYLHPLFENHSTARLMEVVIESADSEFQLKIFESYFKHSVNQIMQHPIGNFALQNLLAFWKDKETFLELYNCVSSCLEDAFTSHHTGVIVALAKSCRNLGYRQLDCIKAVMELLKCEDSESKQSCFVSLLLHLITHDSYLKLKDNNQSLPPISLQGSFILQEMLNFSKPIKVVKSLLDMSTSELVRMGCDPRGSHVMNAFCSSKYVGESSRTKLLGKFMGSLTILACSKHGSRSLEALWNSTGVKNRSSICQELHKSRNRLRENLHGKIIYSKFKIGLFSNREQKDWELEQQREMKKQELLTRFLDETVKADGETEAKISKKKNKKEKLNSTVTTTKELDHTEQFHSATITEYENEPIESARKSKKKKKHKEDETDFTAIQDEKSTKRKRKLNKIDSGEEITENFDDKVNLYDDFKRDNVERLKKKKRKNNK